VCVYVWLLVYDI